MFSTLLHYCMVDEQSPDSQLNVSKSDAKPSTLGQKTVLWNFEDISRLIKTDLPIFGGDTCPCVSLKLRNIGKPVSALTGLDNWLDNLMCNVPDLGMCYFNSGVVQFHESVKAELLPNCSDYKFSTNAIMDVAKHILVFLEKDAIKEGHTYWLFKAHDGDEVKLYDLTTLSNDGKDGESCENPFAVPVGVLFYKLAKKLRMLQKCPAIGENTKDIEKLLLNSLILLEPCKRYQIIASCHYFFSDLIVCDHIEEPADCKGNESMLKEDENKSSGDDKDFDEKYLRSLEHISKAFKNGEKFQMLINSNSSTGGQSNSSTSCGEVCEKKYFLAKSFRDIESPFGNTSVESNHWIVLSQTFLMRKAAVVFIKRAEFRMGKSKASNMSIIQDIFSSIKCLCASIKIIESTFSSFGSSKMEKKEYASEAFCKRCRHDPFLFAFIARMLGEAYLSHSVVASCVQDDRNLAEVEQYILNLTEYLNSNEDLPFSFKVPTDEGERFTQSLHFYDLSYNIVKDYDIFSTSTNKKGSKQGLPNFLINLLRMKATATLDYGTFLANGARRPNSDWHAMSCNAQEQFRKSVKIFKQLDDKINAAVVLLNCATCTLNHAQLMRNSRPPGEEYLFLEKKTHRHAESYCLEGLKLIISNKEHNELWERHQWLLSEIHISLGCLLQENMSDRDHSEAVVKKIIGEFEKALKYCSFDESSSRYLPAQNRKGRLYHRLAEFYHRRARALVDERLKNSYYSEACRHYETSYNMLVPLKDGLELLRIQLERILLAEHMSKAPVEAKSRILKHCSDPLEVVIEMLQDIYNRLFEKLSPLMGTPTMPGLDDFLGDIKNIIEALNLVSRLQDRLSSTLILLIKEYLERKDAKERSRLMAMYGNLLRSPAISFKWNSEQNEWQDFWTKISSTESIGISSGKDVMLNDDCDTAESEVNISAVNLNVKPDLMMKDSKLNVNIPSKVKDLVDACKSLNTFMLEFRNDVIC